MTDTVNAKELLGQLPQGHNTIQRIADNLNSRKVRTPSRGKKYTYQNVWAVFNRGKHYDESVLLELVDIHTKYFEHKKKVETIVENAKLNAMA